MRATKSLGSKENEKLLADKGNKIHVALKDFIGNLHLQPKQIIPGEQETHSLGFFGWLISCGARKTTVDSVTKALYQYADAWKAAIPPDLSHMSLDELELFKRHSHLLTPAFEPYKYDDEFPHIKETFFKEDNNSEVGLR